MLHRTPASQQQQQVRVAQLLFQLAQQINHLLHHRYLFKEQQLTEPLNTPAPM